MNEYKWVATPHPPQHLPSVYGPYTHFAFKLARRRHKQKSSNLFEPLRDLTPHDSSTTLQINSHARQLQPSSSNCMKKYNDK